MEPERFWTYIDRKRKRHGLPTHMALEEEVVEDDVSITSLFARHFSSAYSAQSQHCQDALRFTAPHSDDPELLNPPLTEREVMDVLSNPDARKSAGPDGIPASFWRKTARYFAPSLTVLFNQSLSDGIFPSAWKSYTSPICATKSTTIAKFCVSKMMDKLMCLRLTTVFKDIISDRQHGLMTRKSTTTNLTQFVGAVKEAMEAGYQVDALYLDFSKAFDCLNHVLMIEKLAKYGVSRSALKWFHSYLTGRTLQVKIGDSMSQPYIAGSGVPQGSHLGPMLFLIYAQDLVEFLGDTEFSLYADDLKLSRVIRNINDCLSLQSCLTSVMEWGDRNQLQLNPSKCQTITFNRARRSVSAMYHLGASELKRVSEVKDLGVVLDTRLDFNVHIDRTISKCRAALGLINRFAREFGDPRIHRTLYCALVRSSLDYSNNFS